MVGAIVAIVVVIFLLIAFARTVRIIPQARAGIVERFGRYSRTLTPGLAILVPFMDRLKPLIDLREQVVSFPPQPVITEDNVVVQIDTVLYFTVTDAGDSNKVFVIPSEFSEAFGGIARRSPTAAGAVGRGRQNAGGNSAVPADRTVPG